MSHPKLNRILFLVATAILAVGAVLIRFYQLETKPLHHDESLHAYFSWMLAKDGFYTYNPMLHGPLLYYQTALSFRLFGPSDAAARIAPAIAGTLLVLGMATLRPFFGRPGMLAALALAAFSPMLVYVSRFARHDMWSLLCTFVLVACTLHYARTRNPRYLLPAALAMGLSYANHELTYITIGVWLISIYAAWSWPKVNRQWATIAREQGAYLIVAATLAAVVVILLYSSFYRFPPGVSRALPNPFDPNTALGYWVTQHGVKRGNQPPHYYLSLLAIYEILPFILGFIGAIQGIRSSDASWRFVGFMALITFAAYSVAGERMPWLVVHPLMLLILCAGRWIDAVSRAPQGAKTVGRLAWTLPIYTFTIYNAARLALQNPHNPVEMAVYTQTQPEAKTVALGLRARAADEKIWLDPQLSWPLAWYLRDLPNVSLAKAPTGEPTQLSLVRGAFATSKETNDRVLPFNRWWTPPNGFPGPVPLVRYYLFREIWGTTGERRFRVHEAPSMSVGGRP